MAELIVKDKGGKGKKRGKKQSTFVDLTAMVDLAFLLITFFMLTTTLAKPQSMNLGMPDKTDKSAKTNVAERRTVTLILGSNDKLVWFWGDIKHPFEGPTVEKYGKNGIRKVLLEKHKEVFSYTQDETKGLIVIIKPSEKSKYRNLVDVLDEMVITQVKTYAIVDIAKEDIELLEKEGLY